MTSENMYISDINIQWHPAFCAAAELELSANREDLDFQREYNLSKKPLQIDLLVVEKLDDVSIENEIGRIFRRYNIIEYKSPGDGMTIDDFFKAVGYACIYKVLGETVDQIPADQLTVSLFRENYPEKLFCSLDKYGFTIEKRFKGVYYIYGLFIPAQVVVTKELDSEKHGSLRILSRNALENDVRTFVENAQKLTEQGERANVDAVLQVSMSANYKLYEKMKRRYPEMCEAMRRLMKDEIADEMKEARREGWRIGQEEGREKGREIGREEGKKEGREEGKKVGQMEKAREMALSLADMGIPTEKIAEAAKVSVKLVQEWLSGSVNVAR